MPETDGGANARKGPFLVNVVLLAVTMLALTIWFDRHLAGWVRQTLLLGSGVTLLAAWGIIQGWIKWGVGKELTEAFRSFLGTYRATKLWGAIAAPLLLLLYLGTASLHLSLASESKETLTFDLLEGERVVEQAIKLGGKDRELTRPFFFHFRPSTLRIRVTEPPRYGESLIELRRASALELTLPPPERPYHLLRLIPARGLFAALRKPQEPSLTRFDLTLRRVSPDPASWPPIELCFQTVYAGAPQNDLAWMSRSAQERDDYRAHAERYLDRLDTPPTAREKFHRWWSIPAYYPTKEFRPGDVIEVELRRAERAEPLIARTVQITEDPVQNVFLEVQ